MQKNKAIYNKYTVCILFCFSFLTINAQENDTNFPEDFFGNYKGILNIYNLNQVTPYPMEFQLQPTDSIGHYKYTLIYGDGEDKLERRYTLKAVNAEEGTYIVDENNGIILDQKVIDNRMYTIFEVGGNLLTTFITFEKTQLIFEIVVTKLANKNTSGGTSEGIPEVLSFPISTVQRALLTKY